MADKEKNNNSSSSKSMEPRVSGGEIESKASANNKNTPYPPHGSSSSWQRPSYPNPPETSNPDPATLRDQWRYASRQYSRWYSQAWGAAILAGMAFYALGWIVKGSNPLPSWQDYYHHHYRRNPWYGDDRDSKSSSDSKSDGEKR
ncbi:hypothetical protein Syun_008719 [Stephania yunnanensis]|uniref:Transmembrane protein n=1 Tax=Stephania yunnanensis TaxID=152371 RepID=A0AAP0KEB0_9MAGN